MNELNLARGISVSLCLVLISCSTSIKTELPVIDVIGALKNEKPLNLSEIVDHIEYVQLETKPECLIGFGEAVIAGSNIYVRNSRPASLLVFDKRGKFLRQISRQGKGPGEYINFAYFDVSPDNHYLAIGGFGGGIKLYGTDGVFKAEAELNAQFLSGFRFLNSGKLITYDARMNEDRKGYPVMMAREMDNLKADTLLQMDMEPLETDRPFSLVYTAFYPYNKQINFMNAANDTLYQLNTDLEISSRMVFYCGDQAVTEKNLFISSGKSTVPVYPKCETRDYLFIYAGRGDNYGILAHQKKTGETFRMPVKPSLLDEKIQTYGPENDLEGIDFSFNGLRISDKTWTSVLQISDCKAFFESLEPDQLNLITHKYFDELRRLTEASDMNDNPIVRILYLK
ncbi:MAG: 6-bladed beta-propeller [Bacteroidales bacterium]|jgi:hypothetical protein